MEKMVKFLQVCLVLVLTTAAVGGQEWAGSESVGVEVNDPKGRPIQGARVMLTFSGQGGGVGPPLVATDAKGKAVVAGLVLGQWQIEISHPDFLSYVAVVHMRPGKKAAASTSFLEATGTSLTPVKVKFFNARNVTASQPLPDSRPDLPQLAAKAPPAPRPEEQQVTPESQQEPPQPVVRADQPPTSVTPPVGTYANSDPPSDVQTKQSPAPAVEETIASVDVGEDAATEAIEQPAVSVTPAVDTPVVRSGPPVEPPTNEQVLPQEPQIEVPVQEQETALDLPTPTAEPRQSVEPEPELEAVSEPEPATETRPEIEPEIQLQPESEVAADIVAEVREVETFAEETVPEMPTPTPEPQQSVEPETEPAAVPEPELVSMPETATETRPQMEPEIQLEAEPEVAADAGAEVREVETIVEETAPEMPTPTPEPRQSVEPEPTLQPELEAEPEPEAVPDLEPEPVIEIEPSVLAPVEPETQEIRVEAEDPMDFQAPPASEPVEKVEPEPIPTEPIVSPPTAPAAEQVLAEPTPDETMTPVSEPSTETEPETTVAPPTEPPVRPAADVVPAPAAGVVALGSYRDGSCPDCQAGEWASAASKVVGANATGSGCSQDLVDASRTAMQALGNSINLELAGYLGPVLSQAGKDASQLVEPDLAQTLQGPLEPHLDGSSACQIVALVVPKAVRYTKTRYFAADRDSSRECAAGADCGIGSARWVTSAQVEKGYSATVVWALFENTATRRERRATLSVYFRPPNANWKPRTLGGQ
jgi:hypothetical protein